MYTDLAYSWMSSAANWNMSQSVCSKQSCSDSMAPAGQILTCFTVGFLLISRGLHAGFNITERWSQGPRWGRGAALNAVEQVRHIFSSCGKLVEMRQHSFHIGLVKIPCLCENNGAAVPYFPSGCYIQL